MVRQGDLAGLWNAAAAGQGPGRDGVVGGPEGPPGQQWVAAVRHAADRPQLGGLQGLLPGQVREDGGQALGQHTLPRPRRAHHQHVVPAGGGDLQGPFGLLLALHVGEIGHSFLRLQRLRPLRRGNLGPAGQVLHQLIQGFYGINGDFTG